MEQPQMKSQSAGGGSDIRIDGPRHALVTIPEELLAVPGEVVPFSDLSQSKVRPVVCLADAGRGDWVLCQITSSPYGDPAAVPPMPNAAELGRSATVRDVPS